MVLKGFPNSERDSKAFVPLESIAITSNCTDVDAAWGFVRLLLLEDYQRDVARDNMFPVNNVIFEERLENAMIMPDEEVSANFGGGRILQIKDPVLSQAEVGIIKSFIDSTSRVWYRDNELEAIVNESAEDFFNGRITAQDAARIIQNRVMIYVSEQS